MRVLVEGPAFRRPLILLVLLAGLLAGCGEKERLSKHEYEQKLKSEYAGVRHAFLETGTSFGRPDFADKVADAQDKLRDAADNLEDVEPPKEVEKENEEIVEGLREYADDLDEVHEAAKRGDLEAIEAFNQRIAENKAIERIAEAAEEMKHKGYEVGPIGQE